MLEGGGVDKNEEKNLSLKLMALNNSETAMKNLQRKIAGFESAASTLYSS